VWRPGRHSADLLPFPAGDQDEALDYAEDWLEDSQDKDDGSQVTWLLFTMLGCPFCGAGRRRR
jgi:hypothetical protein